MNNPFNQNYFIAVGMAKILASRRFCKSDEIDAVMDYIKENFRDEQKIAFQEDGGDYPGYYPEKEEPVIRPVHQC